jgi:hypothetical protein
VATEIHDDSGSRKLNEFSLAFATNSAYSAHS